MHTFETARKRRMENTYLFIYIMTSLLSVIFVIYYNWAPKPEGTCILGGVIHPTAGLALLGLVMQDPNLYRIERFGWGCDLLIV